MSDAEARRGSQVRAREPPWKIICKLHFNKKFESKVACVFI